MLDRWLGKFLSWHSVTVNQDTQERAFLKKKKVELTHYLHDKFSLGPVSLSIAFLKKEKVELTRYLHDKFSLGPVSCALNLIGCYHVSTSYHV